MEPPRVGAMGELLHRAAGECGGPARRLKCHAPSGCSFSHFFGDRKRKDAAFTFRQGRQPGQRLHSDAHLRRLLTFEPRRPSPAVRASPCPGPRARAWTGEAAGREMRYAHIVRPHDASLLPGDPPPRKFTPIAKRATTAALDLRTVLRSLRGPRLVLALIAAPFVFAVLAAVAHPRARAHPARPDNLSGIPEAFHKYGYEEIRAGAPRAAKFRVRIQKQYYHKALQNRRKFKLDPAKSITLIAACKNRKESLALSLPSWEGVNEVDEIVLVDWGSESHDWQDLPLLSTMVKSGRVSFIQVQNAGDWALSRAYNLAAQFALGKYLLRVDCDTHLNPNFVALHPRPEPGKYFSVGWGTERDKNEEKLRGVWFALKDDFTKVGGYDERIVNYGYEDLDLYDRLHRIAGLEAKYIDLDSLRHNIAGDIIWPKAQTNITTSHEISTRLNKAILKESPPWPDIAAAGDIMQYSFAYSRTDASLFAKIVKAVPDPLAQKNLQQMETLKTDILRHALHDEFHVPWDIIPSFTLKDLEYLANYFDRGSDARILVVCLDGPDALSNIFNLVSALELGISLLRPVIAVWRSVDGKSIVQSDQPILRRLFDLEATNALLEQVPQSEIAKKRSITSATRLIAAKAWPCVETMSACAEKYDRAYESFHEIDSSFPHVYDDTEPLPLRVRKNGVLKLTNNLKIGSDETRTLAYKSLVQSHLVRVEQKFFGLEPDVGIVADSELTEKLRSDIQSRYSHLNGVNGAEGLPIVGAQDRSLRRHLFDNEQNSGFCEGSCRAEELAREVANVLAACSAKELHPSGAVPDRQSWVRHENVASMMVSDLRMLQRQP